MLCEHRWASVPQVVETVASLGAIAFVTRKARQQAKSAGMFRISLGCVGLHYCPPLPPHPPSGRHHRLPRAQKSRLFSRRRWVLDTEYNVTADTATKDRAACVCAFDLMIDLSPDLERHFLRVSLLVFAPHTCFDKIWNMCVTVRLCLSCRNPFRKNDGWLTWAILGVVTAPFIIGVVAFGLSAVDYEVNTLCGEALPIAFASVRSCSCAEM